MVKFKNPLAITEEDSIGAKVVKKAAEAQLKTTGLAMIGIGVLYYINKKLIDSIEETDNEINQSINTFNAGYELQKATYEYNQQMEKLSKELDEIQEGKNEK